MVKLNVQKGREILEKIHQAAEEQQLKVYAVGGFVRDLYLGKEGTDIDFVVEGDAVAFARFVRKKYRTGRVVAYPRFGTAMLVLDDYKLEFVSAREEHYEPDSRKPRVRKADLYTDLSRRDFTINCLAMHIDPEHFGEVIDIFHGIQDIEARIIRTPLDPVVTFNDDPLRILRAIRFATQLEFQIEEKTYQAILATRERLKIISQERVTEEFKKILLARKPSIGLNLLKETGILKIIFPELDMLSGVEQRQEYHHKDVFKHTLQVVDNIAQKTDKFELRLAALLHDIAKPQTKRFVEGIGWTFHGHEELGARMVERIGRRMRLPVSTIKYVQKLVRLHLRPIQLADETVTDSAIRRLMVEAGEDIDDLMMLCRSDITSKNPNKVKQFLKNFDRVEQRIKEVEEKDRLRQFKPAMTGNDIMEILGIPPGPLVGKIKQAIVDAILDGDIPNEYQACYDYLMKIKDQFLKPSADPMPSTTKKNME
ncbi:MAG: HD domain-containing protein [Calditrichaeota bacterium]|nr:HD domain-containing protein [Calditrichota bacterium]